MTQTATPPQSLTWSDLLTKHTHKQEQPIFTLDGNPPLDGQAFWQYLQMKEVNTGTEEELSFEQELGLLKQLG